MEKLIRDVGVAEALKIGRSTVWHYVRIGKLPKPMKLSARVSVWKESDIQAFIDSMMEAVA
jgi:predicted DNA-binding transcriptional regulator AlpA